MAQKALNYLYNLLKEHKIARGQAEKRGDRLAIENLDNKIACVDYLIGLAIEQL